MKSGIGIGILIFLTMETGAQLSSFQPPLPTTPGYSRHPSVFSQLSNPASLVHLPAAELGLLVEKKYLLQELSIIRAGVAIPVESGAWSMLAGFSGSALYSESGVQVSYSRKITPAMALGSSLEYVVMRTAGYRGFASPRMHFHCLLFPPGKITAGFSLKNPLAGLFTKSTDYLPAPVYSVGIGYDGSDFFSLSCEFSKELHLPVDMSIQLSYRPTQKIRTSLLMMPLSNSLRLGAGWQKQQWRIEVFAAYHAHLGLTPSLQFVYSKPGKKG